MRKFTDSEKELIEQWVVENVATRDLPVDKGDEVGLIHNLVSLLWHGSDYEPFSYKHGQYKLVHDLWGKYHVLEDDE